MVRECVVEGGLGLGRGLVVGEGGGVVGFWWGWIWVVWVIWWWGCGLDEDV